jgi:hypothetical protein
MYGKTVPVLNQLSNMPRRHTREWRYSSTILDLGSRSSVVSFTLRLLYPWWNRRRYLLDRSLGGPQGRFWRCGEEKKLTLAGKRTADIQPVARRYTDWNIPKYSMLPSKFTLINSNKAIRTITAWSKCSQLFDTTLRARLRAAFYGPVSKLCI